MSIFVGLGEVLWDVLPDGKKLGGAPANFAYHVNSLGAEGMVVSRIGDDALGREAMGLLSGGGVDITRVSVDTRRATGTVLAELDADGKASYIFPPDVAWDAIEAAGELLAFGATISGVCFGTLAQRSETSRSAIHAFLKATKDGALRIFDVNLRQNFYSKRVIKQSLELASVLKLSDEELPVLAKMFDLTGTDTAKMAQLVARFDLRLAACTRGGAGSLLVTPDEVDEHPGLSVQIVDTIGAGDSFTAALALGMHAGWPLTRINARANEVAAAVCGQHGAMVELDESLRIIET